MFQKQNQKGIDRSAFVSQAVQTLVNLLHHYQPVTAETANLIRAGVTDNTLKAYRHATQKLEAWLNGRVLNDGLLADYITQFHTSGKSPSTISLVLAGGQRTGEQP